MANQAVSSLIDHKQVETGAIFVSKDGKIPQDLPKEYSFGMQIVETLSKNSDSIFLIDSETGREWKNGELYVKIMNIAASLRDLFGLKTGDNVAIKFLNCDLSIIVALGSIVAGAIVTGINPNDPYDEVIFQAQKYEPKFWFSSGSDVSWAKRLTADLGYPIKGFILDKQEEEEVNETNLSELMNYDHTKSRCLIELPVACSDNTQDIAFITLSSGSTGRPKLIPTTHKVVMCIRLPMKSSMRLGSVTSLDYASFRALLKDALNSESTIVVLNKRDINSIYKAIDKYKISSLYIPVPLFHQLVTYKNPENYDIRSLERVLTFGSHLLFTEDLGKFLDNNHEHLNTIVTAYATSESSAVSVIAQDPRELLKDPANCGKLIAETRLKVVDLETGKLLGKNQKGMLHISSVGVFPGYYSSNGKFVRDSSYFDEDQFYITGDIGFVDDEDNIRILGRYKEIILTTRGMKIFPSDIESILQTHPLVAKASVVGIAANEFVQSKHPRAFIVPLAFCYGILKQTVNQEVPPQGETNKAKFEHKGNHKMCKLPVDVRRNLAEEVLEFVHQRVGWKHQLTGGIVILDELPLLSTGKVDKLSMEKLRIDQVEICADLSNS